MKLFVTGATSFLGSYFLREALLSGHELTCLRRKSSRTRVPVNGKINWIERNLGENLSDIFTTTECFVHFLAAGVTPQPIDWDEALEINVLQSFQLWRQAAESGVSRFVISGSASEYGSSCQRFEPVPPDAPLEPFGPYAASKACSSILARALAYERDLELIYIRAFNLFGEGQYEQNFWPALKKAAIAGEDFEMTAGTQIRDFSPVESAAKFFVKWVEDESLISGKPKVVNFGSGAPKTLIEYARKWWKEFGAKGQIKVGALPSRPGEQKRITPLL